MKNYIQAGVTMSFTATADAASGELVALGSTGLYGVNAYDVVTGGEGEAQVEGVFSLPKTAADTPAQWANAYWDSSAGEVTTESTDNDLIGVFIEAYAAGTTEAAVKLIPQIS